ncbi:Asp23/Gls24 family envelope stress response protein [Streptomyces sp. NPDC058052]|uniref:Asp23/Gls24 family envelope stress response protein n=1 Tax=Streptomyces sp. NPDC058052 TaxID=3346316 RepID=UPI0036F034FA
MRTRHAPALSDAVAEAVLGVPGVACLRPGLRSLLRASVTVPSAGRGADTRGAVLVTFDSGGTVSGLRVDVVVRAQHQAARTARAVAAAAAAAAALPPEAVRVNVTGIV